MARVRSSGTQPEVLLRRALWRLGLRYRVNLKIDGVRVDIVFPGPKVAVFVDGCFWHSCPIHATVPRTRSDFWAEKLAKNVARDVRQTDSLTGTGWLVMRFWEHQVLDEVELVAQQVHLAVCARGRSPTS